jgi:hypothetical protein
MQIMLHPAPAILGKDSVHTTLSITHHTKERPSTSPRTHRSSVTPLMSELTTHNFINSKKEEGKTYKNLKQLIKSQPKARNKIT